MRRLWYGSVSSRPRCPGHVWTPTSYPRPSKLPMCFLPPVLLFNNFLYQAALKDFCKNAKSHPCPARSVVCRRAALSSSGAFMGRLPSSPPSSRFCSVNTQLLAVLAAPRCFPSVLSKGYPLPGVFSPPTSGPERLLFIFPNPIQSSPSV